MDDLISRKAAIDAIEQLVIPEDMCVFEILSHIELAIGTLPSTQPEVLACGEGELSAEPEQRWILCSERLPAVPVCRCLITRDDGRGGVTVEEALFSFGRWYDNKCLEDGRNRKFDISASVIAWAPFLAPYRGGEKE